MGNSHKKVLTPSGAAPLALFDLDYTLLEGDSEAMWSRFLFEKGAVDKTFLMRMTDYYHAYENGHLDIHEYLAFFLRPLTIHPLSRLYEWRTEYLGRVRQALRPALMRRVRRFRALGFNLVLVTAANDFLAEPIARLLRFPNVICTRIRRRSNQFTTEVEGIPAFREGKVQRLEAWLDEHGETLEESWGYGDSHNDLPFLTRVEHPVAVFPDPILRAYAHANGWKIIEQAN